MNKIIFLFLVATALPISAMNQEQMEELAVWRFKYLVESFWPDIYKPELSILEKRGSLLLLRLPYERQYTQQYPDYENDFWGYLNHTVIIRLLTNVQRKDLLDLRAQVGTLMEALEQDLRKKVRPSPEGLTPQDRQQAKEIVLEYRPRILELLKDIKDPLANKAPAAK